MLPLCLLFKTQYYKINKLLQKMLQRNTYGHLLGLEVLATSILKHQLYQQSSSQEVVAEIKFTDTITEIYRH